MDLVGRVEHDVTGLAAERNLFRYRPLPGGVLVRFGSNVTAGARALVAAAARAADCRLVTSDAADEPAAALAARLVTIGADRIRLLGDDPDPDFAVRAAANTAGVSVDDSAPVGAPEIELPRWLHEQSVTITAHRHGRLTALGHDRRL
jgi:RHH-type transcriptional regulator, proline utilization regulon repressor / proline dehydrogenase / delta 1-pyrroline-5-carboxylate dehydrogenase